MPDFQSLADAGGLVIAMTLVGGILLGAVRGWWVPGWIYRQATAERDVLVDDVETLTTALAQQVAATQTGHREITGALERLTDEVRRWQPIRRG